MKKRAILYLCLGLMCMCTAALLVNASTPGKPLPGFNGPLALKEEIRWLEANGLPVPSQAKHLFASPTTLRHNKPALFGKDSRKTASVNSKAVAVRPESVQDKRDFYKPKPAPDGRHRLMATSNGQKSILRPADHSKHATVLLNAITRSERRTLDTDIWIQDFEEGLMPPTGWSVIVTNTAWTWGDSAVAPYEGTYHADCQYDPDINAQDEWFISPVVDMTAVAEPECFLSFRWYASYYWSVTTDNYDLEVRISTDGGTTWEAASIWSEDSVGVFSDWTYYLADIDVSAYLTNNNVKFAWRYAGTDGAEASVDYIRLYGRTPCITCSETDSVEATETADSTWMASDPNGGCNNTYGNYLYDSTACGDTLCGNCFTYISPISGLNMRDTDWYRFSLAAPETVSVWVLAEFAVGAAIVTDECPEYDIKAFGSAEYCIPMEFGICLEAGNYVLIIAPDGFTGLENPTPYRATLKCNGTCTPPPRYDCAAPYVLPTETGTFTGLSTCTATDDYDNTCLNDYDNGEDVILQWTVTTGGTYRIWLDPQGTTYSGIVVDDECPPAPAGCMGVSAQYSGEPHAISCRGFTPGTYYIMVDTWPLPDCIPTFDIIIETCSLVGACCYGDILAPSCETDSLYQCEAVGGTWYEGEDCLTFECPLPPLGACCYGNPYAPTCVDTFEIVCATLGGIWHENELCGTFACPLPPANDTCGAAILIGVPSSTNGTTTNALVDDWAPYCEIPITSGGVWYKLVGTGTTITATTCNQPEAWDTKISVFCGTCGDLQCVIANDDSCAGGSTRSTVYWCSELGITYYVLVHGYAAYTGDFVLDVSEDALACIPTVRCSCEDPDSVTAYKVETGVDVRVYALEAGVYYVWTTTEKNNDGNPNNGLDPQFTLAATLISMSGNEFLSWTDTSVASYENYVVTSKCGPAGRCCYGLDPENLSCADVARAICDVLGGTWKASMTCALFPCNCPTGSTPEGEPDCYDGYLDVVNGGCDSDPANFGTISCGETVCGASGYYDRDASTYEETDWFELITTGDGDTIIWSVAAEHNVSIAIITGLCDDQNRLASASAGPGQIASCSTICVAAGTYWLYVSPADWDNVPCGSRWYGTVTCIPCTPPPNYNCAAPYTLPTETGTFNGLSTCGAINDYEETCLDYYDGGEDIIIEWTVTTPGSYLITMDPLGTTWTGIVVDDECPPVETGCLGLSTHSDATPDTIVCANYPAGTYYIMVDTYPSPDCIPTFNLKIETCAIAECTPDYTITDTGMVDDGGNCGLGNRYANTCLGNYDNGEDAIIQWTVNTAGYYRITLDPQGTTWTGIAVDEACPPASTGCLGISTNTSGDAHSIFCQSYAAGTYYIIVDTYPSPDCIPTFDVTIATCTADYCEASGGCDEYISRVELGTIDNSTACSEYGDYTALSTTMLIGGNYSLTVTNGNSYTVDECGAWIDWNDDFDFNDALETITMSGSPGDGPYTATITPVLGQAGTHRMRIRITYDQTPTSCGEDWYGEVEDYTIVVE